MAKITATGIPVVYPELGYIRITVEGGLVNIDKITYEKRVGGSWVQTGSVEHYLNEDMKRGPSYPLCANPNTMRCALFVLFEWFGEAESCWIEEPKRVILEGEIEPMESIPGVIY